MGHSIRSSLPGPVAPETSDSRPLFAHGLSKDELRDLCVEAAQPAFRADQLWRWLYVSRVDTWEAMRNMPQAFRATLARRLDLHPCEKAAIEGTVGRTRKLLIRLRDGACVEIVLIPARERRTVCVSSQVGCRFRCVFCASGQSGFERNLEAGEIVGQILIAADADGRPPSHVVVMGIGEPLDNYDAVLKAIRIINDRGGLNIGARRITISTSGITPGIRRLADEGLQVELSVSLHAPDDDLRSGLMPVNRRYPLTDLLETCGEYARKTKRIVTFEYTLIRNVNDSAAQARALAAALAPIACRVNLIPLSPVPEFEGRASEKRVAHMFVEVLKRAGINATLRASKGLSLRAACGQLRSSRNA